MSSNESLNMIKKVSEGAMAGALGWTKEQIKDYVDKFNKKELAFIQNQETIDIVKQQYNSGESKFYEAYVKDKSMRIIIRLGLTLRKITSNSEKRDNLRLKIRQKYEIKGLHIAQ